INSERLVASFIKMVQIDAQTRHELPLALECMQQLEGLGFSVTQDNTGEKIGGNAGNVIGKLNGTLNKPCLLLAAHLDRVSPGNGVKPIIKDGVIYSDGTTILAADDVTGIAAIIEAFSVIKERNLEHGPIEVIFTVSEEGGLHGAKNLDYASLTAAMGVAFDSGGAIGSIVVQGPAQDRIEAQIIGLAAHAGVNPENGINAIIAASRGLAIMNVGRIDHETTANVGIIKGGGATNIVPDKVEIMAEARSLRDDKLQAQSEHMKSCLERGAQEVGATANVTITRMYSSFSLASCAPVVKLVERACGVLGIESSLVPSGGGSDANIFNSNGIPSVNLGLGYQKVHTTGEFISIKDLEQGARLTIAIILAD
ncbi:MAG: M20/M25/M40 family metallo-hydrolase, partial [bacterium]|nr:M20/M25/M40 family metallo-hydrolase [bacterium]